MNNCGVKGLEILKKIMKEAIGLKALRLHIQAGQQPSVITGKGPLLISKSPQMTEEQIKELFSILFPSQVTLLTDKAPVKGSMTITGLGVVLLIAEPSGTPSIKFYFPEGHSMFESAWETVANESAAADQASMSAEARAVPLAAPKISEPFVSPVLNSPLSAPLPPPADASQAPTPVPPGRKAIMMSSEPAPLSDPKADSVPAASSFSIQRPEIQGNQTVGNIPKPIQTPEIESPVTVAAPMMDIPVGGMFAMPPPLPTTPRVAAPTAVPFPLIPKLVDEESEAVTAPDAAPTTAGPKEKPAIHAAPIRVSPLAAVPVESNADEMDFPFGDDPRKSAPKGVLAVIDDVLREMVKKKASDLHLTIGQPVCMRIDGEIEREGSEILTAERMKELLLPIMPPSSRMEFAKDSDTDFAYEVPGVARFRVNIFRDRNGVGSVMRQIPSKVLTADQLGLAEAIRRFCTLSKGLVLVTGPTGSGKSTTLAAMVDLINKTRKDHILTIEDPIEFVHEQQSCLVNQREVHRHTHSYARALRAALREDPDIVLIGEMRDLETVEIAIETAETGHLVFGTLHTNTAISTVDRIVDQFPTEQQAQIRVMLSESLRGVVSQTLLKKIGGGRVAAQEILVVNRAVAALIREGKTHMIANQMQSNKAEGNMLLNEVLVDTVVSKKVALIDAFVKAVDKDNFYAVATSKGIDCSSLPVAANKKPGNAA